MATFFAGFAVAFFATAFFAGFAAAFFVAGFFADFTAVFFADFAAALDAIGVTVAFLTAELAVLILFSSVSYTHLTLPTKA